MHRSKLAGFIIDCRTDDLDAAAHFWGNALGLPVRTLGPGEEDVARAEADQLPRYCRFTVTGPKSEYRASILIRQTGVGAISALPAN